MLSIVFWATALVAALLPLRAEAAPLSLASALDLAVQRSEAARAGRASTLSASEAARAAGQLPDPMLRVGIENLPVTGADRFSTTREPMTMKRIGLSQEWLSRDKRDARRAAAEATVGREAVQAQVAAADARLQTALAYLDAFYAGAALQLSTEMEHHAHEQFEAARARLATAAGNSEAALRLGGARGMAEDESAELRQQQRAALLVLERWTGVAADVLDPPTSLRIPSEDDYVGSDPGVVALRRTIEAARAAATSTSFERRPNWTWEVSYGQRTGYADLVTVGVNIPLPIAAADRQDRDTSAKLALVDKAEAEHAEAIRAATADYRALASDARRLQERIERYRSSVLVPAQQRNAAALASYRSNQASLDTLFEARHAEVDVQKKLLALERELARRQAQLALRPVQSGGTP